MSKTIDPTAAVAAILAIHAIMDKPEWAGADDMPAIAEVLADLGLKCGAPEPPAGYGDTWAVYNSTTIQVDNDWNHHRGPGGCWTDLEAGLYLLTQAPDDSIGDAVWALMEGCGRTAIEVDDEETVAQALGNVHLPEPIPPRVAAWAYLWTRHPASGDMRLACPFFGEPARYWIIEYDPRDGQRWYTGYNDLADVSTWYANQYDPESYPQFSVHDLDLGGAEVKHTPHRHLTFSEAG